MIKFSYIILSQNFNKLKLVRPGQILDNFIKFCLGKIKLIQVVKISFKEHVFN